MSSDATEQLFIRTVREYRSLIYKVCYMYAEDNEHLKDLYQEVTANLWQGLESYRCESKMSTWIYRLSINTCVSYLRRHSKHSVVLRLEEGAFQLIDNSDEHAMQLRMMYEMIARLGKLDKAVIMLWLDEYSYEDIASITGLTRNNVASRLHRIKDRLARNMNK